MKIKLISNIAFALATARWRQTVIAAIGVMFSITMFIGLLGFMNGLNDLLDGLILNRTPHVKLYNEVKPALLQPVERVADFNEHYHFIRSVKPSGGRLEIYNIDPVMETLNKDERVLGIAPKISTQVFYNVGALDLAGVISVRFYIIGAVFGIVTTFLAGWLPARKASKVDPVVIIRGK